MPAVPASRSRRVSTNGKPQVQVPPQLRGGEGDAHDGLFSPGVGPGLLLQHFDSKAPGGIDGAQGETVDLRIVSGNRSPAAAITAPLDGTIYTAGQTFTFSGEGSDPEEGPLPCAQMSWTILFHHDDHTN